MEFRITFPCKSFDDSFMQAASDSLLPQFCPPRRLVHHASGGFWILEPSAWPEY